MGQIPSNLATGTKVCCAELQREEIPYDRLNRIADVCRGSIGFDPEKALRDGNDGVIEDENGWCPVLDPLSN